MRLFGVILPHLNIFLHHLIFYSVPAKINPGHATVITNIYILQPFQLFGGYFLEYLYMFNTVQTGISLRNIIFQFA